MVDPSAASSSLPSCWPLAAASRIRVKLVQQEEQQQQQRWRLRRVDPGAGGDENTDHYCRLFYNSKSGAIDLVPHEQQQQQQQLVYFDDDDDIRILEQDPTYQSYLATLAAMAAAADGENANDDARRVVARSAVDSFHPKDIIGANLSFENILSTTSDGDSAATTAATANINIYCYPKLNDKKREAFHKHYMLDPQCCMDFADARLIIHAIQKLSQPSSKKPRINDAALLPPPSRSAPKSSSSTLSSPLTPNPNPNSMIIPLKCLVILNPYSGGGGSESKYGAKHVYTSIVKRMLQESTNILEFDTLVTRHAGHARERMMMKKKKKMSSSTTTTRQQKTMLEDEAGKKKRREEEEEEEEAEEARKIEDEDDVNDPNCPSTLNTDTETKDISHYDAILAMGGDGILFEIFQGIHARSDEHDIFSSLKFAILPCGTYNGLATSVLHWSSCNTFSSFDGDDVDVKADPRDYVELMFHVCRGYTSTLDIACYRLLHPATTTDKEGNSSAIGDDTAASSDFVVSTTTTTTTRNSTENKVFHHNHNDISKNHNVSKSYLSFLTFAWGLIADCDYESECLRWLGHTRSDIWAVYRGLMCRKRYCGRFTYLPPSASSSSSSSKCVGARKEVLVLPKLGEPLPKGWVTYDCEDFLVFWVCNTSHAAHNMHTCSIAKMNDGLFHVLIVR